MLPKLFRAATPFFEAPGGPGGGGGAGAQPPAADANGMYSASYVKELRDEAAGARVRARDATAALADVATQLGVDPEHIRDPARVKHAATTLRTTAAVEEAMARHGVDRRLTRALLDSEQALATLADVAPAAYPTHLDQIITRLAKENPALKAAPGITPARSGLPGSGSGAPEVRKITPRELREGHYSQDRIAEMHRLGLIDLGGER